MKKLFTVVLSVLFIFNLYSETYSVTVEEVVDINKDMKEKQSNQAIKNFDDLFSNFEMRDEVSFQNEYKKLVKLLKQYSKVSQYDVKDGENLDKAKPIRKQVVDEYNILVYKYCVKENFNKVSLQGRLETRDKLFNQLKQKYPNGVELLKMCLYDNCW